MKICHCGCPKEQHNFRHEFQPSVTVNTISDGKITLDILDYPLETQTICEVDGCKGSVKMHNAMYITHPFKPKTKTYRHLKFMVPSSTLCTAELTVNYLETDEQQRRKCNLPLSKHSLDSDHHFTHPIEILNSTPEDRISIFDIRDEDIKIVYTN
jgi:hypothetical protein